ncbi:ParA family protein [Macrococcoides caseolyticum]|uniref:ParA family protein n=1 Tax=Macrococcoides caseolyticum TaxID=69966 RepID=UPI000C32D223|nr:ParA family protein [Macrococcus caseolyticus]PKE51945.1 ParA family protein [Macrococcus caseolyticus]PKF37491.1 ParA family protein [Macrococcus caseolyticus]
MGKIISINNFKGGVSKTSTACLLSYVLSKNKNKKVLLVDFDPQADATELMLKTFKPEILEEFNELENRSIYNGILQENRSLSTLKLNENLDLIPSDINLVGLPMKIKDIENYKKIKVLKNFLNGTKEQYDFIIIDTPPTISDFSNNAIYACDYSLIVMQTHHRSLRAVDKFIDYLISFRDTYNNDFDILGIIPVMFSKQTKIDTKTMMDANTTYKENVFKSVIKYMERVKYWDEYGITNNDHWDKKALDMYDSLADELLIKIKSKE